MGHRAVSDDNNQWLANEFGTSTPFLLHQRTGFVRSQAWADGEPRRHLSSVLQRTSPFRAGVAAVTGYTRQDGARRRPSSKSRSGEAASDNRSAAPLPDDDYAATGIGRNVRNDVRWVNLDLESRPAGEVTIRYEYYSALLKLGVVPRHTSREPLQRREDSRGFSPEP